MAGIAAPELWLLVIASGLYHGLNPGMGWPLAVSAALFERTPAALFGALGWLAVGHLTAMLVVLAPFAVLLFLVEWQRAIAIGAGLIATSFGAYLLVTRSRHPRVLARIAPHRLALWSFVVAIAHGAGLMLVPIYLGICGIGDQAHLAAASLMSRGLGMAAMVAGVHTLAMVAGGGAVAWLVYRVFGLKFISRSWLNLDTLWAASLMGVGMLSLTLNLSN